MTTMGALFCLASRVFHAVYRSYSRTELTRACYYPSNPIYDYVQRVRIVTELYSLLRDR